MKYSRNCLVCDKEVISSNKRTFTHPECKQSINDMKEELKTKLYPISQILLRDDIDIYEALEWAYNLDRPTPSPEIKGQTAEDFLGKRIKWWNHIGESDTVDYDKAIKAMQAYAQSQSSRIKEREQKILELENLRKY